MSCEVNSYNICSDIAKKAMAYDLIRKIEENKDKEAYSTKEVIKLIDDYIKEV